MHPFHGRSNRSDVSGHTPWSVACTINMFESSFSAHTGQQQGGQNQKPGQQSQTNPNQGGQQGNQPKPQQDHNR